MKSINFNSAKDREKALGDFNSLIKHPGWNLVVYIAHENIELLRNQIIEGVGEGETLDTIARLRDKLKAYEDIIKTPETMIEKLKPVEAVTHDEDDPYPFIETKVKPKI